MALSPDHVAFLKAVAHGDMDEHSLQTWWNEHYEGLRRSVPIWLLLRFLHGGRLAAELTLKEMGESQRAAESGTLTSSEWQGCSDPARMLESMQDTADADTLRRFAVACCRRQERWLTQEWVDGIEVVGRACVAPVGQQEWGSTLEALVTHFREVVESDNGEIYAAKQAVLASFDPNPLCAAVVASTATLASVLREREDDSLMVAEQRRQADLLRKMFARPRPTKG